MADDTRTPSPRPPSAVSARGSRSAQERELLIQNHSEDLENPAAAATTTAAASSSASDSAAYESGREAFYAVLQSWVWQKFMSGCVILLPIAVTFYITWWFIEFVDGFFRPVYISLGIHFFGLGFVTTILFIFLVGVFVSSWMGASVLSVGEWLIKKMPLVRHIYSASKQISAAISPGQNTRAFQEVVIVRHPRVGEYAIGFITSSFLLQNEFRQEELCSVYVPTNHLYIGDIFLLSSHDIIRPNLSVREGLEIVASVGMSMPQVVTPLQGVDRSRPVP